ncbi:hypothetical protein F4560_003063 [Saccharothrix ecbatanensis]|uniref:Lipoprotein n=1 Tax=Saccharothrix ecbatanensis TaxID=1105145 RepID=A0A7W9HJD9_9PSEU|nr:hypothetical protein [Saccharothrix ecbatanensis]MBB5803295.1 hypothetical protein [Saccharothrix ecbatanensis]
MNRTMPAVALAAVLLVGACGGGTPVATSSSSATSAATTSSVDVADEEEAVRKAFADYREAAQAKDGVAAAALLSQDMLDYYTGARDLALTGSEQQVREGGVTASILVYVLRAEFDAAELGGMSAEQLVSAAVEKGLVSENSLDNVELGTVVVDGDTARADLTSRGQSAGVELPFHKEDGSWRFDLGPLMVAGDEALETVAGERGVTVEQLVDTTLGTLYGADRVPELKKPLQG